MPCDSSNATSRAFSACKRCERLALSHHGPMLCEQRIHVFTDAVADVVAGGLEPLQARPKCRALRFAARSAMAFSASLEHSHQRAEVGFVVQADIAAESRGPLAIEDHQFRQPIGRARRLLVVRDGLLGLGHRGVLILEHIGPQPAIDGGLVGLEHVFAEVQAGVQKGLVVLACGVEVLHQGEQAWAVEVGQLGLDVGPAGLSAAGHRQIPSPSWVGRKNTRFRRSSVDEPP